MDKTLEDIINDERRKKGAAKLSVSGKAGGKADAGVSRGKKMNGWKGKKGGWSQNSSAAQASYGPAGRGSGQGKGGGESWGGGPRSHAYGGGNNSKGKLRSGGQGTKGSSSDVQLTVYFAGDEYMVQTHFDASFEEVGFGGPKPFFGFSASFPVCDGLANFLPNSSPSPRIFPCVPRRISGCISDVSRTYLWRVSCVSHTHVTVCSVSSV